MDTEKDKNIKDNFSKNVSLSNNNIDPISFFQKDETFVFLYKKTEKLTTAMYMITNLFSDSEPMKWTLRKKMSDLMSFTLGYKDLPQSHYYDFTHNIKTKILEIVSLLEVSSRSGLVSPMNFSILKQEFSKLISTLDRAESTHNEYANKSVLTDTFFNVSGSSDGSNKEVLNSNTSVEEKAQISQGHSIKDTKSVSDNPVVKRNYRQNVIVDLLKKKKEIDIKDITQVIRDCSEKTIQRELISLINSGVLKKTGERRWSKYSLA